MRYLLNPCFLPLLVVLALTGSRGGQAAPQALGSQNSSQPMNTTSQRTQDGAGRRLASGHLSEADVRWRTDPRGEGRFAPVRRPAIESGRATLTKMDLAELPVDNNTYHIPRPRYPQLGCKTLQSKMQISDGFCTSIEPVKSVICEGNCLPEQDLPWFAQFMKLWGRTKVIDYVCEDDVVRRKKVELVCENGETRKIRIKVVRSCKCTKLVEPANRPLTNKYRYSTKLVDSVQKDRDRTNRKHRRRKHRGRKRRKDKRRRKDKARKDKRRNGKRTNSSNDERTVAEL